MMGWLAPSKDRAVCGLARYQLPACYLFSWRWLVVAKNRKDKDGSLAHVAEKFAQRLLPTTSNKILPRPNGGGGAC